MVDMHAQETTRKQAFSRFSCVSTGDPGLADVPEITAQACSKIECRKNTIDMKSRRSLGTAAGYTGRDGLSIILIWGFTLVEEIEITPSG